MANQNGQSSNLSGSELQQSQSGGGSGEAGGTRGRQQSGQSGIGGQQAGGAAEQSDMDAGGGSSGEGGYGNAQNQSNHQGQQQGQSVGFKGQDRGAAFDEAQGGGRDASSVSADDTTRAGGSSGDFDEEVDG